MQLSELLNMLKLVLADQFSGLQLDMAKFAEKYMKCVKVVRAPTEVCMGGQGRGRGK